MHGSPLSKWDNRDLWKRYDYRDFGIIAEPYFDLDFDEVFYLTDTGRRWDGSDVSVRDKVGGQRTQQGDEWMNRMIPAGLDGKGLAQRRRGAKKRLKNVRMINTEVRKQGKGFGNLRFRSTFDIIAVAEKGLLPDKIMLNVHPQRWTDNPVEWMKELVWQNVKNLVKRGMIAWRQG